jgi:predicted acylesterase/phospholipase RssA
VATDLLSGEPVYFSSQFVYCRPYGWIDPNEKDIGTAEALYSSAAFPAVFPPRKLKVRKLSFQNGAMPGALPRTARLVDGGVYNNLGTDWFVFLDKQLPSASKLWPTGELKVEMPDIRLKNVIVVNAGAPSQRVRWLGPLTLARIMSVLYDNTVRPRVQALQAQDQPLIDIAESPMQLAKRLVHLPDDEGRRAQKLVNLFSDREEQFWADFVQETAGTRTKLTSAGPREGARLMLHGYLSSLVLLHVRFGAPLPEPIRGEQYFLTLVRRPSTPSSAVKQPAVGRAKESGRT